MKASRSPKAWTKLLRGRLAAVAIVLTVVAGCASSGEPTSYDSTVENNYLRACQDQFGRDRTVRAADAPNVCRCAWVRISTEIPFEDFRELDNKVRGDPSQITEDETGVLLTQIMAGCTSSSQFPA